MTTQTLQPNKQIFLRGLPNIRLPKSKLNVIVDTTLLILFIGSVVSAYTNTRLHEWLSGGLTIVLVLHLWLHWAWVRGVATRLRNIKPTVLTKLTVDVIILLAFSLTILSGLVVMLIYAPSLTAFHNRAFYAVVVLLLLHLWLNRKWIISQVKRNRK